MSRRIEKVNELIKEELGMILKKEFDLSAGGYLMTITRVETTPNLQEARVYISTMPDNILVSTAKRLERDVFYFQQLLNKRLDMRPVPKIIFIAEKKTKEAARIENLLEKIKNPIIDSQ